MDRAAHPSRWRMALTRFFVARDLTSAAWNSAALGRRSYMPLKHVPSPVHGFRYASASNPGQHTLPDDRRRNGRLAGAVVRIAAEAWPRCEANRSGRNRSIMSSYGSWSGRRLHRDKTGAAMRPPELDRLRNCMYACSGGAIQRPPWEQTHGAPVFRRRKISSRLVGGRTVAAVEMRVAFHARRAAGLDRFASRIFGAHSAWSSGRSDLLGSSR